MQAEEENDVVTCHSCNACEEDGMMGARGGGGTGEERGGAVNVIIPQVSFVKYTGKTMPAARSQSQF